MDGAIEVVKVGGSLLGYADAVLHVLRRYPRLIVPGGGVFADAVRAVDRQCGLSDRAAHYMAILAMEQYAWLLADRSGLRVTRTMYETDLPAIFLPFDCLCQDESLAASWDVTSDTIACHVARLRGADRVLLLKDVAGLLDKDKVVPHIEASRLLGRGQTCVDAALPRYLYTYRMDCWLIDGRDPAKVQAAQHGRLVGTLISGREG